METTTGPALWLILLTIGVICLGAAAIYGMMRNRRRTLSERVTTEVETKHHYQQQNRDDS
ncbi:hypothetical protein [Devosia sp. CAU 1758]